MSHWTTTKGTSQLPVVALFRRSLISNWISLLTGMASVFCGADIFERK